MHVAIQLAIYIHSVPQGTSDCKIKKVYLRLSTQDKEQKYCPSYNAYLAIQIP